ncbi:MAG: IPTL-CTERM sorting domain-containing protein [Planctomycetes bacterium]|nr:IPTL-CTERM sorting domain-containing protein [Planctomycetota bacterium]MBI3833849.1 IPTL-CTERM sorting domain-containing protein [Planctomycetota bacterium]
MRHIDMRSLCLRIAERKQPVFRQMTIKNLGFLVAVASAICVFTNQSVVAKPPAASGAERLVTGDAARIGHVVTGTGATLKFYFTPRPPLPGALFSLAYPQGYNITGQKLVVSRGGFYSAWITQIEGWDPMGTGNPLLRSFQDKIDANSFKGENASPPNPGCNLVYPAVVIACQKVCAVGVNHGSPCTTNGNCPGSTCVDQCPNLLGEPGPKCGGTIAGVCDWGWQNTFRADWVLVANAPSDQIAVAQIVSPTGPVIAGVTYPGVEIFDTGVRYYTGTLVLPVPACSKGVYTIGHKIDETFAQDQAQPANDIPVAAFVAGQLSIPTGSCCTDFTTPSQATCTPSLFLAGCDALTSTNLHVFRPDTDCNIPCAVECVADADCDDLAECTDDTCAPDQTCLHTRNEARCNDGLDCTDDVCTSEGACVHTLSPACNDGVDCTIDACAPNGACVHTLDDAICDDGLFCNGAETCTAAGCQSGEPPCAIGETCDENADTCTFIPIPTVSQWGLAVMALMLLIAAKIGFRRRAMN